MESRTWSSPLPEKFLLGGEQRFFSKQPQLNQGWILRQTTDTPPIPAVELLQEIPGINFRLFPRFNEPSQPQIEPLDFDPIPRLVSFSWDWIEFIYQPKKNLEVKSIYWSPDSGVICGESWITNRTDQKMVIFLDLVCILQSQAGGNQITLEKINGRPILTGSLEAQNLVLFLSGNPNFKEDPSPYLQTKLSLEPNCTEKVHWICIKSDTKEVAQDLLENVLQLDWSGEISHRKVALQSQLEITTGDPDWDFVLALSQKQSLLRYHQLTSQDKLKVPPRVDLTPIQALMLLQSLENQTSDTVKNILDLVFNPSIQPATARENSEHDYSPPLLAAELLWQIHQWGFSSEIWSSYLEKAAGWLEDWFSASLDRDADGIPELEHPRIMDLAGSGTAAEMPSANRFMPYPYLESPGLGALIYNDLCKIDNLLQISGGNSDYLIQERKGTLFKFLQESWNSEYSEFQNRDSHSHEVVDGFNIFENLQPGLNILRTDFQQPTRIGVLHHRPAADHTPGVFSVICHGLDWLGNYRIEELQSADLTWGDGIDWGLSESVYSKLDYCILKEDDLKGHINLIAPTTSGKDITQTLPLWAGVLPDDQTREIFENVLLDPDRFWSPYGFCSPANSGESTVHLFWNLLLGQSLLKLGKSDMAAELIGRWMAAIIPVLNRSGSFFPGYGVNTGQGMGAEDSLESLFPVKFFLEVLGIGILQDNQLTIEGRNPFHWPVTLRYRDLVIIREKNQTTIIRPGKDTLTLTGPEKFQLDLI